MSMASKLACVSVVFGAIAILPAAAPAQIGARTPAPELETLAFLVGDWTCTGKMSMGSAHDTMGTVRVSRDLGGFWYVGRYSETKSTTNPCPMSFEFIQGYDSAKKTFTMTCFQADGGQCSQTSAGWEAARLVYSGEMAGTPVRTTLTQKGRDGLEHLGEVQVNGEWVETDYEICTRVVKK
jgi:hypothetical protein